MFLHFNNLSRSVPLVILLACGVRAAVAQQKPPENSGAAEFGVWGGGTVHTARIASRISDFRIGILGLSYAHELRRGKNAVLQYTLNFIPAAVLAYPKTESDANGSFVRTQTTTFAAGMDPVGLRIRLRPQSRLQPFACLSGGFLYFADKIPNGLGTRFNFTASLGGGLQFRPGPRRVLWLGYMIHHISNAERGTVNSGFGSGIMTAGLSILR